MAVVVGRVVRIGGEVVTDDIVHIAAAVVDGPGRIVQQVRAIDPAVPVQVDRIGGVDRIALPVADDLAVGVERVQVGHGEEGQAVGVDDGRARQAADGGRDPGLVDGDLEVEVGMGDVQAGVGDGHDDRRVARRVVPAGGGVDPRVGTRQGVLQPLGVARVVGRLLDMDGVVGLGVLDPRERPDLGQGRGRVHLGGQRDEGRPAVEPLDDRGVQLPERPRREGAPVGEGDDDAVIGVVADGRFGRQGKQGPALQEVEAGRAGATKLPSHE
ncbi:MAG: hypothetical protein U0800_15235 [Isosphaeraceae bacterium]